MELQRVINEFLVYNKVEMEGRPRPLGFSKSRESMGQMIHGHCKGMQCPWRAL